MIRNTLLLLVIILILHQMRVWWLVAIIDNAPYYWNYATIYVLTFSVRHPYIFMFLPHMCILLILSLRYIDAEL